MTTRNLSNFVSKILPKFDALKLNPIYWVYLFAGINIILFNYPLYSFTENNIDIHTSSGLQVMLLLTCVLTLLTTTVILAIAAISLRLVKVIVFVVIIVNAAALYFMREYSVVLDRSMIGNILNTRFSESGQFLDFKLFLCIAVFGLIPALFITCIQFKEVTKKMIALNSIISALALVGFLYAFSGSWLWFDKHGRQLGGMVLPWSYVGNYVRHQTFENRLAIEHKLLPDASLGSAQKTLVVLIIGESARAQNFELYGYERHTNPRLSKLENLLALKPAKSCATYTTAALECILSNTTPGLFSGGDYEPLPSYLHRNGVNVVWRTRNWGETKLKIDEYIEATELSKTCEGQHCDYDGVLLENLTEQIETHGDHQLIVLHQSGSHGPSYSNKYPAEYEQYTPVCDGVDLKECGVERLVNSYDNTILYTDYFISEAVEILKSFTDYDAVMLYVSDHGESLGEHGLYLHGTPLKFAPEEQTNIPFLVWMSDSFIAHRGIDFGKLEDKEEYSQDLIFHSVMGALNLQSEIYNPDLDLFAKPSSFADSK